MKLAILCLLVPALAHAEDTFDVKAQAAQRVTRADDVVWALTATCDKGDDTQQRQCRQIRDRAAKQLTSTTLWIDADPQAFEVGPWSAAKKSVSITLTACVRCGGVDVDGHTYYMTGPGPKVDGGRVRAAVLYDNARQVADEAAALAWKASVAKSRVELIIKVNDKQRRVTVGGKDALPFDVVAWRVVNPCDGAIVISSMASGPGESDKRACKGGGVDVVPDALTPAMVQDAMKPVVVAARACFDRIKTPGKTKIELTINGDGTVAKAEQTGDFTGQMAQCIDDAVKKAKFPRTKKPTTRIGYPIVLQ